MAKLSKLHKLMSSSIKQIENKDFSDLVFRLQNQSLVLRFSIPIQTTKQIKEKNRDPDPISLQR